MHVHYFDYKNNRHGINLPINPNLFEQYLRHNHDEYYIIKCNGIHVLHNNQYPTVILNNDGSKNYLFFNFGSNIKIQDLPIDDHTKCMLTLKYTLIEDADGWHCYQI